MVAVKHRDAKIAKIARAQEDGRLSDRYPADFLLLAALHIAALRVTTSPEMTRARKLPSAADRRRIVTQMMRDLLADEHRALPAVRTTGDRPMRAIGE